MPTAARLLIVGLVSIGFACGPDAGIEFNGRRFEERDAHFQSDGSSLTVTLSEMPAPCQGSSRNDSWGDAGTFLLLIQDDTGGSPGIGQYPIFPVSMSGGGLKPLPKGTVREASALFYFWAEDSVLDTATTGTLEISQLDTDQVSGNLDLSFTTGRASGSFVAHPDMCR
jgi:hypothetical protein